MCERFIEMRLLSDGNKFSLFIMLLIPYLINGKWPEFARDNSGHRGVVGSGYINNGLVEEVSLLVLHVNCGIVQCLRS